VEFGLLGPLVVRAGGSRVTVTAGKQRVLLAALLLRANQVVPAADLARFVWEGGPPGTARVTLQNYVKRLRHALGPAGPERIVTRPAGYLIEVRSGELDVARFGELVSGGLAAARAGVWERASAQLGAGLGLWRGEPLADVPSRVLALAEVPRLAEMRLDAVEARIDADLHLGRHREVIAELGALAVAEPLRERLAELLMVALYRSGQQAAALGVYRQARRRLVEEIGIEPGPGLRGLNQQILKADPALLGPSAPDGEAASPPILAGGGPSEEPPGTSHPSLLPAAVPGFTGRVRELRALSAMPGRPGGPVLITAIGGTAGVGKTALAVHWARQHAGRFPDGQLYVNLRGFGPGDPVPPAEALRGFLDALQVPADEIPATPDGRHALYRSLVAGKKILVLLDNARDPAQVRPLLPATASALVLVTSRSDLASLVVTDGAGEVSLDVLTDGDARQMLARRLGPARVAAEPAAADELIGLCARLPLALAITAARAAAHPGFSLAVLAGELRDARGRLDALSTGEDTADVRAVFSWSYANLPVPAARMFRLLGLHPGPDITAQAAASLADLTVPEARRLLRDLTRGHLLTEHSPGRYAFHDLLRAYAAEQAELEDPCDLRDAAARRMLDHYLHTAHAAAVQINAGRGSLELGPARPGTVAEVPGSHEEALAWLAAEHQVLRALIGQAMGTGFNAYAWQLTWAVADYLEWHGQTDELSVLQEDALAAAERAGDRVGQATMHRSLGRSQFELHSWDKGRAHLFQALELCQALGDRVEQAQVHLRLGHAMSHAGRDREALGHGGQALMLFEEAGHRPGQARALSNIGFYHAQLGDFHQALARSEQALAAQRELGERCGEASTLDTLGCCHQRLGHYARSEECFREAIALFANIGSRNSQAEVLAHLGDMYSDAGRHRAAVPVWQQALDIFEELHHPEAEQVREKLSRGTVPIRSLG
jgi:DNA-binding SARP family transcriptional activator/tetratricopeptide (TPR) repeat protein